MLFGLFICGIKRKRELLYSTDVCARRVLFNRNTLYISTHTSPPLTLFSSLPTFLIYLRRAMENIATLSQTTSFDSANILEQALRSDKTECRHFLPARFLAQGVTLRDHLRLHAATTPFSSGAPARRESSRPIYVYYTVNTRPNGNYKTEHSQ